MIVIVSYPEDPHAARVKGILDEAGESTHLLDISDFPNAASLSAAYDDDMNGRAIWHRIGKGDVDLGTARAIWWRRIQQPDLSAIDDPEVLAFTHGEWNEALNGLWQLIDCPWMNPPARDEVAARKLHQLKVARALGLRIPRTLATSDPDAARAFIDREGLGHCIYKTFLCTHAIWRETRKVGRAELDMLESLRLGPAIFQEYIPAGVDYRVTMVGDAAFAGAIDPKGTSYDVDFRMALGETRVAAAELPAPLIDRLRAFMKHLGLIYGAIDLRRTPDGDFVFLEVNTAGEFLFVEDATGQPIAQAIADWLIRPV